ncbi:hypothetical protein D770_25935 [Flammeovirgaceae bacterium 311]|nr:hypothetical protein D770_25935 [Flammeovirgaceae bacterium 311]
MTLYIEFPMLLLRDYEKPGGKYQTADDHITDLVQKPFEERGITSKIKKIDIVDPAPNTNDELLRYELEADVSEKEFNPGWILQTFEKEGYEKGLTIKDHHGESLYHDEDTADILLRRKFREV